jgi:hypothetical protein
MAEFNVRADDVNVEQIMHQIRARIREKRGVDYTEEQIQELAKIKLEKFLDPRGLRSDLLEQFQRAAATDLPPNFEFDDLTLSVEQPVCRLYARLLQPVLKLFFSPNPLIRPPPAGCDQPYLMRGDAIFYELMHNLVVEMTRTGIEVKNMKMRVESIAGRLDFNERRARALEAVVQYKPEGQGGRSQQGPPRSAPRGEAAPEPGARGSAAEGHGGRASGAEGQGGADSPAAPARTAGGPERAGADVRPSSEAKNRPKENCVDMMIARKISVTRTMADPVRFRYSDIRSARNSPA